MPKVKHYNFGKNSTASLSSAAGRFYVRWHKIMPPGGATREEIEGFMVTWHNCSPRAAAALFNSCIKTKVLVERSPK